MFRNDGLCEKSGHDVDHRFVDWCSEVLSLVRWPSPSWYFEEPVGTIFGRGGGAIIVSLTINETIMCKMNILFYWRRLETNSCGNNLLKYKSSEMWVHFFCIDFHTSDFFFETKCVVSFWTCTLKTKLVHWLYFSDPAAICLYSLYLLHVIVTWPKFQFETFTWPLC